MNLEKINIKDVIIKNGFRYKKSLGQNFITDSNLLRAIAMDSGVSQGETVVEIGTGAGGLTLALSEAAGESGKVYSFEVDKSLQPVLEETLKGRENIEVIFRDVLKMSDEEITDIIGDKPFRVAANLPYYITTPLIMRFLESTLPAASITVMVQLEVAQRMSAKANNKDYSALTLAVDFYGNAKIVRRVGRNMFFPIPDVDSALIRIDIIKDKYPVKNKQEFLKLISGAFAYRRKTLANNIATAFNKAKQDIENALKELGFDASVRGEVLTMEDFLRVYNKLFGS